jgi:predicted MFS family arabinose efflux permease
LAGLDHTDADTGIDRPASWLALITLATFAPITSGLLPAIVGVLVDSGHASAASAGRIGSFYSLAGVLAGLLGIFWIGRVDRRIALMAGIFLGLAGDLSAVWLHQLPAVAAGRLATGFAASTVMIVANATIARSHSSRRLFGIVVTAQSLLAAALFFALPRLSWDAPQVFLMLAVFWALLLPFALLVPRVPLSSKPAAGRALDGSLARLSVVLLCLGFLCFYIATGVLWTFLYLIGEWHQIAPTDVGSAISLGMLFAIPGSLAVTLWGKRRRSSLPLIVAVAASAAFTLILLLPIGGGAFALVSCATSLLFTFALALFLTLLGEEDPQGRLLSVGNTIIFGGLALGPLVFAPSSGSGYLVPLVAAVAFFATSSLALAVRHLAGRPRSFSPSASLDSHKTLSLIQSRGGPSASGSDDRLA